MTWPIAHAQLIERYIANLIGYELPESGLLRPEDLDEAQRLAALRALDLLESHFLSQSPS